jgi:hypothetical protein
MLVGGVAAVWLQAVASAHQPGKELASQDRLAMPPVRCAAQAVPGVRMPPSPLQEAKNALWGPGVKGRVFASLGRVRGQDGGKHAVRNGLRRTERHRKIPTSTAFDGPDCSAAWSCLRRRQPSSCESVASSANNRRSRGQRSSDLDTLHRADRAAAEPTLTPPSACALSRSRA